MPVEIPLTKGFVAIVDDEDADLVQEFKWYALVMRPNGIYAARTVWNKGNQRTEYLHRLLLNPPPGFHVDHKNRDTLDDRRENLRVATPRQNMANAPARSGRFKGVRPLKNIWTARITIDGRDRHLGCARSAEEAARMYDAAALEIYGEFALLNFPIEVQS